MDLVYYSNSSLLMKFNERAICFVVGNMRCRKTEFKYPLFFLRSA